MSEGYLLPPVTSTSLVRVCALHETPPTKTFSYLEDLGLPSYGVWLVVCPPSLSCSTCFFLLSVKGFGEPTKCVLVDKDRTEEIKYPFL